MTRTLLHSLVFAVLTSLPVEASNDLLLCRNLLLAAQPTPYADRELVWGAARPQSDPLSYHGRTFAFGPNSRWIYALQCHNDACVVRRWATHNLALDAKYVVKVSVLATALAVSVDGEEIAVASTSMINRYNAKDGKLIATALVPYTFPTLTQVLYTENANHLVIAGENGNVVVNGLGRARTTTWGFTYPDDYLILADRHMPRHRYAEPGKERPFGSELGTPERIDELNELERATQRTLRPGYGSPVFLAGSPDGKQFTVSYLDGTSSVFNSFTGNEIAHLNAEVKAGATPSAKPGNGPHYSGSAAHYTADGQYLVTTYRTSTGVKESAQQISVWDADFGTLIRTAIVEPDRFLVFLKHPGLVRQDTAGTLYVHDFFTGKALFSVEGGAGQVKQVVGTPDGKWLFTLTDSEISVWDLKARTHHRVFADPNLEPLEMQLSPNAKHLLVKTQGRPASLGRRHFLFSVE